MSNQYVFNDRLPLAPLKIAALESCRDLAQKVNDHIVNFRRNDAEELLRRQGNLQLTPIFSTAPARVSEVVKQRGS